jgi:DNA-binding PadR family transcriptional regulator
VQSRRDALEFALLGLLAEGPLHGYELRRRLTAVLGPFRALSFSVIYPQLRRMVEAGLITETEEAKDAKLSKRKRIVYQITDNGMDRFTDLIGKSDAKSWDDEFFEVHFAFFGPTPLATRVRILEGRWRRLKDKAELLKHDLDRASQTPNAYLSEYKKHKLEVIEREIEWIETMLTTERDSK